MWRSAINSTQKKAILNMLIPITWESFYDSVVAFCGDEDDSVSSLAFEKLLKMSAKDIKKRVSVELPQKSLEAIFKASSQKNAAELVFSVIYSTKALPNWILKYLHTTNVDFWKTLVTHNDFLMFSEDIRGELESFLKTVDAVVLDLYKEHFNYISAEKLDKFRQKYIHYFVSENFQNENNDIEDDEEVVDFDDDDEIINFEDDEEVVDFDTDSNEVVDFDENDIPDFMISENAFSGLNFEDAEDKRKTIQQITLKMTVGQKIKLATTGNLEVRKFLLKDPRQQVAKAVLSNARITEKEIESIIQSNASSREIIDAIANSRELTKKYRVKLALVMNPKTPIRVALRFLDLIRMNDLKKIAKSRNIPNVIKLRAKKKIR